MLRVNSGTIGIVLFAGFQVDWIAVMTTKDFPSPKLPWWIALTTISFFVPVSPWIKKGASLEVALLIILNCCC